MSKAVSSRDGHIHLRYTSRIREAGGTCLIRAYHSLLSPGPLPSPPTAEVFAGLSPMSHHSPQEDPLPFSRHVPSASSHDQRPSPAILMLLSFCGPTTPTVHVLQGRPSEELASRGSGSPVGLPPFACHRHWLWAQGQPYGACRHWASSSQRDWQALATRSLD